MPPITGFNVFKCCLILLWGKICLQLIIRKQTIQQGGGGGGGGSDGGRKIILVVTELGR